MDFINPASSIIVAVCLEKWFQFEVILIFSAKSLPGKLCSHFPGDLLGKRQLKGLEPNIYLSFYDLANPGDEVSTIYTLICLGKK